jgi:hypothetical protein
VSTGGTMKYMMFVCTDPSAENTGEVDDVRPWVEEMDRRGIRLHGDRVQPSADATTVRVRDGELLLTDGPFAETKEQIAGYDVIDCADLDEAIEVAAKHPMARYGLIEVRPFWTP